MRISVAIVQMAVQTLFRHFFLVIGVVPLDLKKRNEERRSEVYRLCEQFGAKIVDDVTPETTHLVAVQWGTRCVQSLDFTFKF